MMKENHFLPVCCQRERGLHDCEIEKDGDWWDCGCQSSLEVRESRKGRERERTLLILFQHTFFFKKVLVNGTQKD